MSYILMKCPKCGYVQKYSLDDLNHILQHGGHKPTCRKGCKWSEYETPNVWDNHVYLEIVDISDELNENLMTCAKLRGSYPLMEKTLYEFSDFCNKVIESQNAVGQKLYGDEGIKLSEKYLPQVTWDDQVLVTFSRLFLEYCRTEYANRRVD